MNHVLGDGELVPDTELEANLVDSLLPCIEDSFRFSVCVCEFCLLLLNLGLQCLVHGAVFLYCGGHGCE